MRVSDNTNFSVVRDGIQRSKEKLENLQFQSATMKKVNIPSDDPVGAAKILELRTDKMNNEHYHLNSKMAEAFLENTDQALSDLTEIILRAKEITISQSSAASSNSDSRMGVAEEVNQLLRQGVAIGNRKMGERYLFGGYKTQKPPIGPEGEYLGDQGHMMLEIADNVYISTNVTGYEAFNTHPQSSTQNQTGYSDRSSSDEEEGQNPENVNLFDQLQDLRIGLITGNTEGIRSTLERFDQIFNHLVATRSKVGSRLQGIATTMQSNEKHSITNASLSSSIQDADMAQVVTDLNKEEAILRSSLASSKKLIQPTLLEFLR